MTKQKTRKTLAEIIIFTVIMAVLTVIFFLLSGKLHKIWMTAAAITFLTIFYHFAMRLIVGEVVTLIYRNREFNQNSIGFKMHGFEDKLYRKLKVKSWKAKMATAKPEQFDLKEVSPEELLHNVMQAELVHRLIMVLSFVPLLFIIPFGEPLIFILTSIAACIIDMIFVIIQRYNRPRVIRLMKLCRNK